MSIPVHSIWGRFARSDRSAGGVMLSELLPERAAPECVESGEISADGVDVRIPVLAGRDDVSGIDVLR
ncbi:MAG TPA: hypothetical protein PK020_10395 [Ilumatobacteraceae bacterium]|nr:hypothetical protein [Ilumatobacteraceae bacterium]